MESHDKNPLCILLCQSLLYTVNLSKWYLEIGCILSPWYWNGVFLFLHYFTAVCPRTFKIFWRLSNDRKPGFTVFLLKSFFPGRFMSLAGFSDFYHGHLCNQNWSCQWTNFLLLSRNLFCGILLFAQFTFFCGSATHWKKIYKTRYIYFKGHKMGQKLGLSR